MKIHLEENKRIKLELNKMIDESNQICRILDKDDVDIKFINQIGKKSYLKSPNSKKTNMLPNLIYHQGQDTTQDFHIKLKTKHQSHSYKKKQTLNDFHTNFFKILKGSDNDQILNSLMISKNLRKNPSKKEEKKQIENKLNLIVPEIMKKKKVLTKRIPLYIKKFKKNYEYVNNQLILDEINEKRYTKYHDPFIYSLNLFPYKDVLPKYNNLFFKYKKSKIRDYFYRNTFTHFHSKNKTKNKDNFAEVKFSKLNSEA